MIADSSFVKELIKHINVEHDSAIALDFDGVCKLFAEHKHQIMSTLLFLYFPQFQKMPLCEYKSAYNYINFASMDYAGKVRFLCINALANYLSEEKGYACKIPALDVAIKKIIAAGNIVNATTLRDFAGEEEDIKLILAWSKEVDARVSMLTGIGLTPGIKEYIFDRFAGKADFYLVSTAPENSIRASMEIDNIFFIKRYFGQDTACKTEALIALVNSGYKNVFMFGDSIEDYRASSMAKKQTPTGVNLIFVPVMPDAEKSCFAQGMTIIIETEAGNLPEVRLMESRLEELFNGQAVVSNRDDVTA